MTYVGPRRNEFTGINEIIEARGWNYHVGKDMDDYHAAHPHQPNVGSEQGSTVSTRGTRQRRKQRGYVSAYDDNKNQAGRTRPKELVELLRRASVPVGRLHLDWLRLSRRADPLQLALHKARTSASSQGFFCCGSSAARATSVPDRSTCASSNVKPVSVHRQGTERSGRASRSPGQRSPRGAGRSSGRAAAAPWPGSGTSGPGHRLVVRPSRLHGQARRPHHKLVRPLRLVPPFRRTRASRSAAWNRRPVSRRSRCRGQRRQSRLRPPQ